jgi:hypothetical protein
LRLGLASAPPAGLPNRRVVELLMRHAWRGGADANDAQRLQALQAAVARGASRGKRHPPATVFARQGVSA